MLTRERRRLEALATVLLREESLNKAPIRAAAGVERRLEPESVLAESRSEADYTALSAN